MFNKDLVWCTMRQIEPWMVRDDKLILLTSRDLTDGSIMMAADFSDMQAIRFNPTGSWVGIGVHGVKIGTSQLEMIDGIWYTTDDEALNEKHKNTRLSSDILSFEMIE